VSLTGQAVAEVVHNLIVQLLAAASPAPRARQLFDATAQAFEADDVRRSIEVLSQLIAQSREEREFKTFS
jgi:broad specificity phosphatase PhoE